MTNGNPETYLECERKRVYFLLMLTAGFYGAYTYSIRGGIFCNAQTGNFVLLAMALGSRNWMKALYLLLPINAYMLGAVVSELLPVSEKRPSRLRRWPQRSVPITSVRPVSSSPYLFATTKIGEPACACGHISV